MYKYIFYCGRRNIYFFLFLVPTCGEGGWFMWNHIVVDSSDFTYHTIKSYYNNAFYAHTTLCQNFFPRIFLAASADQSYWYFVNSNRDKFYVHIFSRMNRHFIKFLMQATPCKKNKMKYGGELCISNICTHEMVMSMWANRRIDADFRHA